MRVIRSHWGDDRGAAGVIVGISVVMLFGFGAFAIDAGHLWQERRHIIRASDAAALAAAQEFATGGNGCDGLDDEYTTANDSRAAVRSCTPVGISAQSGLVTVTASTPVDFIFAGLFGVTERTAASTTTASYEVAQTIKGLRPFGMCESVAVELRTGLLGTKQKIFYDKESQTLEGNPALLCPENASGNWGLIDLDNGGNVSKRDQQDWTRNGYDGSVGTGTIAGSPGAFGGEFADDLEAVRTTSEGDLKIFCLPVFADVTEQGANAEYDVTGFIAVTLWDYTATGPQSDRYLEVRVEAPALCAPGNDGGFPAVDFGVRTVRICAVDFAEDTSEC